VNSYLPRPHKIEAFHESSFPDDHQAVLRKFLGQVLAYIPARNDESQAYRGGKTASVKYAFRVWGLGFREKRVL
jgi:hypothetical protein